MFDKIEKAFDPVTSSVYDYYQDPGVGLYIPLYQREYSWDGDNIDQLLDDLAKGVDNLIENPDREIRFLGTIIAVNIGPQQVYPLDRKALPGSIQNIIDGQQRLSTISLFSTLLYKYIDIYQGRLKAREENEELVNELYEACKDWKTKLTSLFALDLKRGEPELKPKIIRGSKDQWTMKNGTNKYKSQVSNYLAQFIDVVVDPERTDYPSLQGKHKALQNLRRIDRWLRKIVIEAHISDSNDFAPAWDILRRVPQEYIWIYERPDLEELVRNKDLRTESKTLNFQTCILVQLFTVSHYLLGRCCFTKIQPMNEDWAFDMFQSLNATGTPLTAIETFKPLVVNVTDKEPDTPEFHGSNTQKSFAKVDDLFEKNATAGAAKKNKLANEFLTSFALASTGTKLATHFSRQRKFLDGVYSDIDEYDDRVRFINFFGNYAEFYGKVWSNYRGANGLPYPAVSDNPDGELASLLLLFLMESNHKMAITVLASFYSEIIDGREGATSTFVEACKLIGGFYALWRASDTNAGLDNVYRSFFKKHFEDGHSKGQWEKGGRIEIQKLRRHLQRTLEEKREADNREVWVKRAKNYLGYDTSKSVSRLALYISAHDTQPDPDFDGLMKTTRDGVVNYLTVSRWISDDLKTVEHVAPREPKRKEKKLWGENIYEDETKLFERIGNLTLLPADVNTSVSNKGWLEKYIYYQHLAEKDGDKQKELGNKARKNGIELGDSTIALLQKANYNDHIRAVVSLGEEGEWDAELIEHRSERILGIFWDRVSTWVWP